VCRWVTPASRTPKPTRPTARHRGFRRTPNTPVTKTGVPLCPACGLHHQHHVAPAHVPPHSQEGANGQEAATTRHSSQRTPHTRSPTVPASQHTQTQHLTTGQRSHTHTHTHTHLTAGTVERTASQQQPRASGSCRRRQHAALQRAAGCSRLGCLTLQVALERAQAVEAGEAGGLGRGSRLSLAGTRALQAYRVRAAAAAGARCSAVLRGGQHA
jgi:hypothetical protein